MPRHSALSVQPDLFADVPADEDLAFECWTDGVLTAAAVGPKDVAPSEWMSLIWEIVEEGPEAGGLRAPLQTALSVAWGEVVDIMRLDPSHYAPRFLGLEDEVAGAMVWSDGFQAAMSLRRSAWISFAAQPKQLDYLAPIILLSLEDADLLDSLHPRPPRRSKSVAELRQECADDVPTAVAGIYRYWHGRHSPPVQAVGRNTPCPCGSGRKYKKCCLR